MVGQVVIEARRERDSITDLVSDDGAGIDLEAVRQRAVDAGVVHPRSRGRPPAEQVAALVFANGAARPRPRSPRSSGRGRGMDSVRTTVESLGGSVEITTERGRGTHDDADRTDHRRRAARVLLGVGEETVLRFRREGGADRGVSNEQHRAHGHRGVRNPRRRAGARARSRRAHCTAERASGGAHRTSC